MKTKQLFFILILSITTSLSAMAQDKYTHAQISVWPSNTPIKANEPFLLNFALMLDTPIWVCIDINLIKETVLHNFNILHSMMTYSDTVLIETTNHHKTRRVPMKYYKFSYIVTAKDTGLQRLDPICLHCNRKVCISNVLLMSIDPTMVSAKDSMRRKEELYTEYQFSPVLSKTKIEKNNRPISKYLWDSNNSTSDSIGDFGIKNTYKNSAKPDRFGIIIEDVDSVYTSTPGGSFVVRYAFSYKEIPGNYTLGSITKSLICPIDITIKQKTMKYTKSKMGKTDVQYVEFNTSKSGSFTIESFDYMIDGRTYTMPKVLVVVK